MSNEEPIKEKTMEELLEAAEKAEEKELPIRSRMIGLIVGFAILFLLHWGPRIPGLAPVAQTTLGVFLWFIAIMVTDAFPRGIVGLATPLLLVIMAGMKIPQAFSAFTSNVFFLGAGAFIFAGIMMGTPLGRRISLTIVNLMRSNRVTRILLGLSVADLGVGIVIPTVSETALFLPIAKGVSALMKGKEHLPEVRRINVAVLLLICGLVPLYTGLLILTSHFPNIILAGMLNETEGIYISWGAWLWYNLPLWGLLPIMFIYVVWFFKLRGLDIPGAADELPKMKEELGKITWPEQWALICLGIGLLLWIFAPGGIKTGMVAIIVATLMFMPWGRIEFAKINPHILWEVLILLGGAISLGKALHASGAVEWMAGLIVDPIKGTGWPVLLVLIVLVAGLHVARAGIVSAVAMGAMFAPMAIGIAKELHYNILPFTLVVINCLSYAFFLPMSITAFFIAWGVSGESFWRVVKFGALLSIISNLYVIIVQTGWLALIGHPM